MSFLGVPTSLGHAVHKLALWVLFAVIFSSIVRFILLVDLNKRGYNHMFLCASERLSAVLLERSHRDWTSLFDGCGAYDFSGPEELSLAVSALPKSKDLSDIVKEMCNVTVARRPQPAVKSESTTTPGRAALSTQLAGSFINSFRKCEDDEMDASMCSLDRTLSQMDDGKPKSSKKRADDTFIDFGDEDDLDIDGDMAYEHESWEFLKSEKVRDANRRRPDDPEYDPSTLWIPNDFLEKQTPGHTQWWKLKTQNYDTILFFKVGKFYELYHMDPVISAQHLSLSFMRGKYTHTAFPEIAFGRFADQLVSRGYKVYALYNVVNYCSTPFGRRLLRQWICKPTCDPETLTSRQDAIEWLTNDGQAFMDRVDELLKRIPDLARLLQKIHTLGLKYRAEIHPDPRAVMFESTKYNRRKIKDLLVTLRGFEATGRIVKGYDKLVMDGESATLIDQLIGVDHIPDITPDLKHVQVPGVAFSHMACMVEGENEQDPTLETVTFLYRLVSGICPKSYGFYAVKLAGIDDEVDRNAYFPASRLVHRRPFPARNIQSVGT
ncbi:unnamed protein product, partial [Mesorhabditis spiculigera]